MVYLKVIGLCGGSGVGKGYVGRMFSELGISVIDTDAVYHELVSRRGECLDELCLAFGDDIIAENGALDRVRLAGIVFSDSNKHKLLNTIAHKHVLKRVRQMIRELFLAGVKCVMVDAPMLFESGFDKECDFTLGVVARDELRVKRITARDGITAERALARINAQLSCESIAEKCDFVIENNGDENLLLAAVNALGNKFLN